MKKIDSIPAFIDDDELEPIDGPDIRISDECRKRMKKLDEKIGKMLQRAKDIWWG